MDENCLKYWLALKRVDGIGNVGFKSLVDALGTPEAVFHSSANLLTSISGIGKLGASRIKSFHDWQTIEREIKLAEKKNVHIITYHDSLYPSTLLHIYDLPPILYVMGTLTQEDINIAVVGSRLASTYGKYSTEKLCRELAFYGVTVVSGMARGIDSAAHRGAIAGKGRTIAVLGCGLDIIYPPENEKLFHDIASHGALITEFPFGTPPNAPNFPARNRIISGISLGVVVVEATDKSGSLITARIAAEQGREVYAVPGSIDSAGSKGTNKLIKEGAKLVENVQDILDEIASHIRIDHVKTDSDDENTRQSDSLFKKSPKKNQSISTDEATIWNIISEIPADVNAIIQSTGWNTGKVLNVLMQMELNGFITQLPGNRYVRKP